MTEDTPTAQETDELEKLVAEARERSRDEFAAGHINDALFHGNVADAITALRTELTTLRASDVRLREALTIAETTIADLERANASYQAALSERGIDGSKGTEE